MRRNVLVRTGLLLASIPFAGLCFAGCGSPSSSSVVSVAAAASLRDAFTQLGTSFEATNPGTLVEASFAASSTIGEQVTAGAPIEVLATASERTMSEAAGSGLIGTPRIFAANSLAIVVPSDNPANIATMSDLRRQDVTFAMCQPQVPCGATADEFLQRSAIAATPVTREPDVRAVLAKVVSGEVDAGIVYRTDVIAAGPAVKSVMIPASVNVITRYPIALVEGADGNAPAFVAYVLSSAGKQVLAANGFIVEGFDE